jgi:hypothetical protein
VDSDELALDVVVDACCASLLTRFEVNVVVVFRSFRLLFKLVTVELFKVGDTLVRLAFVAVVREVELFGDKRLLFVVTTLVRFGVFCGCSVDEDVFNWAAFNCCC